MNHKITLLGVVLAGFTFLSGCGNNNSSTAEKEKGDTAATEQASAAKMDTTSQMSQTNQGSGNGLMASMNAMMDRMKKMSMTSDFDVDWANMMIEHHQGGIDMAQIEVSQGKDEKMKAKAQEIITKQKEEQQKLRDFVSSYKPSGMKHGEGELQKSMQTMTDKMKGMPMSGDTDKDFAQMMSSHHQDGISMAKMELKNGMSQELKQMAQKSMNDQQKDITEFKDWLSHHR